MSYFATRLFDMAEGDLPQTPDTAIRAFITLLVLGAVLEGFGAFHRGEARIGIEFLVLGGLLALVDYCWVKIRMWLGAKFTATATAVATDFRWWVGGVALIMILLTAPEIPYRYSQQQAAAPAAVPMIGVPDASTQRRPKSFFAEQPTEKTIPASTQPASALVPVKDHLYQGITPVGELEGKVTVDEDRGTISFEEIRYSEYPKPDQPLRYGDLLVGCEPMQAGVARKLEAGGVRCRIIGHVSK